MLFKRVKPVVFASALSMLSLAALADEPPKVVATFSVLGDIVSQIGGENIELTTLVERGGDAHVFRPSPFHAQAVSRADMLVVNGLGFEGWLERLEESSGFDGMKVVASEGIAVLKANEEHHDDHDAHEDEHEEHDHNAHEEEHEDHDHSAHGDSHESHEEHMGHDDHHHGEFDPHAWHSVANVKLYALNIANGLKAIDPVHADKYESNYQRYLAQLNELEVKLHALADSIPADRKEVITSHDAFGYLARDYGFEFDSPQGISTETEASASDVAALIRQIKAHNIKAVFFENVADNRLVAQISNETGAKVGGELYSGALSEESGPAATYVDMMTYNMTTLVDALR